MTANRARHRVRGFDDGAHSQPGIMSRMTTTVADPVLDEIVASIVARFAPMSIVLFGSRARGDHGAGSDYDLMVVVDSDTSSAEACERAIRSGMSAPGRWVDAFVPTALDFARRSEDVGTLEYSAKREGRILYESCASGKPPRVRERPRVPESFAEWTERAESDYVTMALALGDDRVTDAAAFHAHQCAEKYLKAALIRRGIQPPRTHQLTAVLGLSETALHANADVRAACVVLEELWPKARYPRQQRPTAEEAAAAARAARIVRDTVRG
jgi:HEPN domain-containing protein/predicted nucleotidyltransferase